MNAWTAYRDPAARRRAVNGAQRPPLPIRNQDRALERAVHLHHLGFDYRSIAQVMGHYHGVWAPTSTWSRRIRQAGHSDPT